MHVENEFSYSGLAYINTRQLPTLRDVHDVKDPRKDSALQ